MAELAERYSDWHRRQTQQLSPAEKSRLCLLWRDFGKHWPPYGQVLFLIQPDVQAALGESECGRLLRHLRKQHDQLLREAPSHAWADAWGLMRHELPREWKPVACELVPLSAYGPQRQHAVRMKRRRAVTDSQGRTIRAPGRWLPPQCHAEEQMIDDLELSRMTPEQVGNVLGNWQTSPSALVMQRIAAGRMHEERWKGRERRRGTPKPGALSFKGIPLDSGTGEF